MWKSALTLFPLSSSPHQHTHTYSFPVIYLHSFILLCVQLWGGSSCFSLSCSQSFVPAGTPLGSWKYTRQFPGSTLWLRLKLFHWQRVQLGHIVAWWPLRSKGRTKPTPWSSSSSTPWSTSQWMRSSQWSHEQPSRVRFRLSQPNFECLSYLNQLSTKSNCKFKFILKLNAACSTIVNLALLRRIAVVSFKFELVSKRISPNLLTIRMNIISSGDNLQF